MGSFSSPHTVHSTHTPCPHLPHKLQIFNFHVGHLPCLQGLQIHTSLLSNVNTSSKFVTCVNKYYGNADSVLYGTCGWLSEIGLRLKMSFWGRLSGKEHDFPENEKWITEKGQKYSNQKRHE
jgi:hypothetical protein